jgi:chromosome segregation ATPase
MDDRMIQHLEQQLVNAHSANSELRARLVEAKERDTEANSDRVRARDATAQLEKAHAKQKKAEDNAAAAQRKQADAERQLLRARGELEELRERFEIVKKEAVALTELNERVAAAGSASDLFS